MKTKTHPALAATAALAVAFSPVLFAQQTAAPDQSQNTRTSDSTADQHAATTGSSASQPGTLEKNNSKDAASETRDANPGTANTDSAAQSATKDPSVTDATQTSTAKSREKDTSSEDKPMTDKQFMLNAAQGGMTEVALGKIAAEKGSSSEVKEFGSRMVSDHSDADSKLQSIAKDKGVMLPEKLDAHHQAMVDHMSKMSGPSFDKAYVRMMVRDHEKDAADFQKESESAKDPAVKSFAADTLKTVQSHLEQVKKIQGDLK